MIQTRCSLQVVHMDLGSRLHTWAFRHNLRCPSVAEPLNGAQVLARAAQEA